MNNPASSGCPLCAAGTRDKSVTVKEIDPLTGEPTGRLIRMSAELYEKLAAMANKITDEEALS